MNASAQDLYGQLLQAWNDQDADSYAGVFADDGEFVGFDGSQVAGAAAIADAMSAIFADHATARYVWVVREVRSIAQGVSVLRGEAGMVPRGGGDVMEDKLAVQCLVAVGEPGNWKATLFINTPARFDGRPEASRALLDELRALAPDIPS